MSARVIAWSPPRPAVTPGESDRWWHFAACLGADADLFFPRPDVPAREEAAKAYCAGCPVTRACLLDALAADDRHAVRGGLAPAERLAAYPQSRRCQAGLHPRTPENTGTNSRCLPCQRASERRQREEERLEKYGTTAPQYGRRAAA